MVTIVLTEEERADIIDSLNDRIEHLETLANMVADDDSYLAKEAESLKDIVTKLEDAE